MRKAGQISQTTIEAIIIAGIVIVLNIIGQYFYVRLDLTKDKSYTLAAASKEIVASLPDKLYIKVYVNNDLPPQVQQEEQRLSDLLEEYRAAASNQLTIQTIHTNDMTAEELAAIEQKGIQKQQYRAVEAESAAIQNVYMGVVIDYLDKTEIIPFTPTTPNLEYAITSAVLKLTSTEQPTIGFLTGHGEATTGGQYTNVVAELKKMYNVQDIDLGAGERLDGSSVKTLIIANPTSPISERHRYVIDQFLMRGGKLVVLQSGFKLNEMTGQADMQMSPLDSLLTNYGVKINNDVVIDTGYNMQIPAGNMGGFRVMMPYPPIPMIGPPYGFPSDSPATRGLTSLVLPFVSSLSVLYDKVSDQTKVVELAKTSDKSYSRTVPVDMQPQQDFAPPGGPSDLKPQLVAVELDGVFKSAFEGVAVPQYDASTAPNSASMPPPDTEPMLTQSAMTSLVVIGNAAFIEDQAVENLDGNAVFFLNLMETLNLGDKLISIRTRAVVNRPLNPDLTSAEKNGLRFWGYGAVPALLTLFGVARFYLKVQRKRLLQSMQHADRF
jgi:ABC-2 type transport system permease protein